jgi:hypothetical protein
MNLSDSFKSTQDNQVYIMTHEGEEYIDDDTISIEDDSYEERHRGICENCHHIGIVGTECENCKPSEWASIVKIPPEWQTYLNKTHHEESLRPEALMRTMETHGIGICSNCNRISTKGFYCRVLSISNSTWRDRSRRNFNERFSRYSEERKTREK